jgi:hypothetical protein
MTVVVEPRVGARVCDVKHVRTSQTVGVETVSGVTTVLLHDCRDRLMSRHTE